MYSGKPFHVKLHCLTLLKHRSWGGSLKRIVALPFSKNFAKTCAMFPEI